MGQMSYLRMRTEKEASDVLSSDLKALATAATNFANHSFKLGTSGFFSVFLEWLACFSAIYLLVLDRTNWKTNILTSLLIPYIYLSFPSLLFGIFSGEIGKWIAFVAIVLRLFFPKHFPDWLELPGALILLTVVAPSFLSSTIRNSIAGVLICLVIACYLLQEHIRASGGFRNAFTKANGVSNTIGIVLLFVFPVWAVIVDLL
jgi:hypothetical protein